MSDPLLENLAVMPMADLADAIGVPLDRWPGNCYGIAMALVESGLLPAGTRAVYGHWRGPIAETSMFAGRRALGFTGHGWAVTPDDRVVDPTRWVFEDVTPYLYLGADPALDIPEACRSCEHLEDEHEDPFGGRCTGGDAAGYDCGPCLFEPTVDPRTVAEDHDYDEGGNQLRTQRLRPFPETDPDAGTTATCPPADVAALLAGHGYRSGPLTVAQAMWAGNLPLAMLGPAAASLYTWLDACGLAGLVPIDNRMAALGGSPTAA